VEGLDSAVDPSPKGRLQRSLQKCSFLYATMDKEMQISALVSRTTKELLERHVRATGVKKGHLVEQALRHHLQALEELPADVVVHPRLVVTRKSGEAILEQIETGQATPALRTLMRDGDQGASRE
jgi:hypothetical protein